jgi:hypothetical protein
MKNRHLALALLLTSLCGSAFSQSVSAPQLPPGALVGTPSNPPGASALIQPPASFTAGQKHRFGTVQAYMAFPSPLQWGDQLLAGMGDEAAADLLIMLASAPPLSVPQMQTAMDIVHKSFFMPRAIQNVADRKPTASLALLQKFQATAVDQTLKERIAAENNFLNAVPKTFPPLQLPANLGPPPAAGTTPFN